MTNQESPILYVFSGLPGVGKSTLARKLAFQTHSAYLRIDTIEQALRDTCGISIQDEGYRVAYKIAYENLKAGLKVVADACNPIGLTRRCWEEVAKKANCPFKNIEVVCSDLKEHRRRVESRLSDVEGLRLPTWEEVLNREYEAWSDRRHVIDTATVPVEQCLEKLLRDLSS